MKNIIIFGSNGSGKKTLMSKLSPKLMDYHFEVHSFGFIPGDSVVILLVDLKEGPNKETANIIAEIKRAGVINIFCFLNKSDLVKDRGIQGLIEMECRELATQHGYTKDSFFVNTGSAQLDIGIDDFIKVITSNIEKTPTK